MFNHLRKKIVSLMLFVLLATQSASAIEAHSPNRDNNLTDTQLHAVMGIITNFILSSGSGASDSSGVSNVVVKHTNGNSYKVTWKGNPNVQTWVTYSGGVGPKHNATNNTYTFGHLNPDITFTLHIQGVGSDTLITKKFTTLAGNTISEPTYYVDATAGNDNNDGLSQNKAWKTLGKISTMSTSFEPGDIIALKAGEVFYGTLRIEELNGTQSQPIEFTSYGDGVKPILTGISTLSTPWINEGEGRWKRRSAPTVRLWKDGVEQRVTAWPKFQDKVVSHYQLPVSENNNVKREFGGDAGAVWTWSSRSYLPVSDWNTDDYGYLYYYSENGEPAGEFKIAGIRDNISVKNSSYITFSKLDIQAARHAIDISDSNHLIIRNNNIGSKASSGVILTSSNDNLIERNYFDAEFQLEYVGFLSYTGTDFRGVSDGASMWNGASNNEIRYNSFINWGHAAVGLSAGGSNMTNNNIHHNFITTEDISYGRFFGSSGLANNNEIHHNYIENTRTKNQLGGHHNHVHHNVWDGMTDGTFKYKQKAHAIQFQANGNHPSKDNIVEYNTMKDISGAGITFSANLNYPDVINNIANNNLLINTGSPLEEHHRSIYFPHYEIVLQNSIINNAIIHDNMDKPISYRGKNGISVEEFNSYDGNRFFRADKQSGNQFEIGDTIQGNINYDPENSSVGAGDLSKENVGVNGHENQ